MSRIRRFRISGQPGPTEGIADLLDRFHAQSTLHQSRLLRNCIPEGCDNLDCGRVLKVLLDRALLGSLDHCRPVLLGITGWKLYVHFEFGDQFRRGILLSALNQTDVFGRNPTLPAETEQVVPGASAEGTARKRANGEGAVPSPPSLPCPVGGETVRSDHIETDQICPVISRAAPLGGECFGASSRGSGRSGVNWSKSRR